MSLHAVPDLPRPSRRVRPIRQTRGHWRPSRREAVEAWCWTHGRAVLRFTAVTLIVALALWSLTCALLTPAPILDPRQPAPRAWRSR